MKITKDVTDIEAALKDAWLTGYKSAIIVLLSAEQESPLMAELIKKLGALLEEAKPDRDLLTCETPYCWAKEADQ